MNSRVRNNRFFPKFAHVPVICVIILNFLAYTGTKYITLNSHHYDLAIPLDGVIPFVPWFISFYILSYFQWIWNYVYHTRLGEDKYYHIVTTNLIAKFICLVSFILIPAEIERPVITEGGFWNSLTQIIYSLDTPTSLFPSVHCVESWLCFRASCMVKDAPRWYAPFMFVFTIFVFASTVLVKQHFIVDVFAGIIAIEIAWFLSRRFGLWRVFRKTAPHSVKERRSNED